MVAFSSSRTKNAVRRGAVGFALALPLISGIPAQAQVEDVQVEAEVVEEEAVVEDGNGTDGVETDGVEAELIDEEIEVE